MLTQIDREIGGKTYRLTALAANPGRAMMIRLLKLAGPSVSAVLRSLDFSAGFKMSDLSGPGIADAFNELCQRISPEEFEDICKVFLSNTEVLNPETGGFMVLQPHFAFVGDYGNLFKVLGAGVEHNYASFFEGLGITKLPVSGTTPSPVSRSQKK